MFWTRKLLPLGEADLTGGVANLNMDAEELDVERPWRAALLDSLFRDNVVVQAAWLLVILILVESLFARLAVVIPGLAFLIASALELGYQYLGSRGRAWLLVINYVVMSLIGYALAGFFSGPALMACAACLLALVFLGRRVLLPIVCIFILGTCLIGWLMVIDRLPWELLEIDMSTRRPQAWMRTTLVSLLLLALMGLLVARIMAGMEAALADNARLREKAEQAVRLRDEFLSLASHELRTPLGALKLAAEGLTSGQIPATPMNLQRTLGLVHRNVERLTALVGQLLDVSQSEMGRLNLSIEEVNLSALIREVIELFGARLGQVDSISLDLDPLVQGRWDRSRLERVAMNLIENALKFGAGKPIEISVRCKDGRAILVVRDHGGGISSEIAAHIFDRFFRGISSRAGGGLGLGLFIVRTFVEAMGGTIRVDCFPDDGTSFTVELPSSCPPSTTESEGETIS